MLGGAEGDPFGTRNLGRVDDDNDDDDEQDDANARASSLGFVAAGSTSSSSSGSSSSSSHTSRGASRGAGRSAAAAAVVEDRLQRLRPRDRTRGAQRSPIFATPAAAAAAASAKHPLHANIHSPLEDRRNPFDGSHLFSSSEQPAPITSPLPPNMDPAAKSQGGFAQPQLHDTPKPTSLSIGEGPSSWTTPSAFRGGPLAWNDEDIHRSEPPSTPLRNFSAFPATPAAPPTPSPFFARPIPSASPAPWTSDGSMSASRFSTPLRKTDTGEGSPPEATPKFKIPMDPHINARSRLSLPASIPSAVTFQISPQTAHPPQGQQIPFLTPQPKLVRPSASAFMSAGLVSKKSRPRSTSAQNAPETPSKKHPLGPLPAFDPASAQNVSTPFPTTAFHSIATPVKPYFPSPLYPAAQHLGSAFNTPLGSAAKEAGGSRKHRSPLLESPSKHIKKVHAAGSADFESLLLGSTPRADTESATGDRGVLAAFGSNMDCDSSAQPGGRRTRSTSSPTLHLELDPTNPFWTGESGAPAAHKATKPYGFPPPPKFPLATKRGGNFVLSEKSWLGVGSREADHDAAMDCGDDDEERAAQSDDVANATGAFPVIRTTYTTFARFFSAEYTRRLLDGNPDDDPPKGATEIFKDYLESEFKSQGQLGSGAFADVIKVESKSDGRLYAVKKSKHPLTGRRDRRARLVEVDVLWAVSDIPQCVQLVNAWEQYGYIFLQMELCERGSLQDFVDHLNRSNQRMDEYKICTVVAEVASGLKHMHDRDIIHLDLKPSNILITTAGQLKIGDFGLASRLPVQDGFEHEGDRTYMAPEALESRFGKPNDIFSLGLIVLELAADIELPQNGPIWHQLREADFSAIRFAEGGSDGNGSGTTVDVVNSTSAGRAVVSPPLVELIKGMMEPRPERRATADAVLRHPFVAALVDGGGGGDRGGAGGGSGGGGSGMDAQMVL